MADAQATVALNIGSQRISMGVFEPSKSGGLILKKYDSTSILADPAAEMARLPQIRVAVSELAEPARIAARPILSGPRSELPRRIAAELAQLISLVPEPHGNGQWRSWGKGANVAPGLQRLISSFLHRDDDGHDVCSIPESLSPLINGPIPERLAALTVGLMKRASHGEAWAVDLLAKGASWLATQSDISPRLGPGLVWIGCALALDEHSFETLTRCWPPSYAEPLRSIHCDTRFHFGAPCDDDAPKKALVEELGIGG